MLNRFMRKQFGSKGKCILVAFLSVNGLSACIADSGSEGSGDAVIESRSPVSPGLRAEPQGEGIPEGCSMVYRADMGKQVLHCPDKSPPPPP